MNLIANSATHTISTPTFSQIQNENFQASYGDGEVATGIVGTETITLAGITVPGQEVGIVNLAAFDGDGVSSGILGLAFPSVTSAFSGTDPSTDQRNTTGIPYNPIFSTISSMGLVAPLFSVALNRDDTGAEGGGGGGGSLTLSSIASDVATIGSFVSPGLQEPTFEAVNTLHFPELQEYTITIDGLAFQSGNSSTTTSESAAVISDTSFQYNVDTGSALNLVDSTSAAAINALFQPPATQEQGIFVVDCNATPPPVGVTISGQTFQTNPADMIVVDGQNAEGSNIYISGMQDGGSGNEGPLVLSDVFLKSVLAIFDVGNGELRFAARA